MARYSSAIQVTSLGGPTHNGLPEGGGYRWRGKPGWNPAAAPPARPESGQAVIRRYTPEVMARRCEYCGALAGIRCTKPSGRWRSEPHYDRWAGAE